MSIRDLLIQAPHLCGAEFAEKHAEVADVVWEREQKKKGFTRRVGESAHDRIAFLFAWPCANQKKRDYCRELAHLNVLAHYGKEHGDSVAELAAMNLQESLAIEEALYPDVAKVLTVEAAARGWWDA